MTVPVLMLERFVVNADQAGRNLPVSSLWAPRSSWPRGSISSRSRFSLPARFASYGTRASCSSVAVPERNPASSVEPSSATSRSKISKV